jgi:hypothetical protein
MEIDADAAEAVLLACVLTPVDDLGYFAPADVGGPLALLVNSSCDTPGFSRHLEKFLRADRGGVLEKDRHSGRFRLRFVDPLLQPYVIMRGLADGLLTDGSLEWLRRKSGAARNGTPLVAGSRHFRCAAQG